MELEMLIAEKVDVIGVCQFDKRINVLISSLALGGAEKIVVDWLMTSANQGYSIVLNVLFNQEKEHKIGHENIVVNRRVSTMSITDFLDAHYNGFCEVVSTHLISDEIHFYLWSKNVKTIPVIHNDKRGWKCDPVIFNNEYVPHIVACADYVSKELRENGYKGEIKIVKHLPLMDNAVYDFEQRKKLRFDYNFNDGKLCVACIGSIKEQKNYLRVVEIARTLSEKGVSFQICVFGDAVNQSGKDIKNQMISDIKHFGLASNFRFFGFTENIYRYFPMFDIILNTSFYEGFSIATQEGLLADIPVFATRVSGQTEINLDGLNLFDLSDSNNEIVERIMKYSIRKEINKNNRFNNSMLWNLAHIYQEKNIVNTNNKKVLFITANLNAGGAQRSLVNLVTEMKYPTVAVCNQSTNDYFASELKSADVSFYQAGDKNDIYNIAYNILSDIYKNSYKNVVYWNVDPKIKMLVAKFVDSDINLIDVSPGHYAHEEMLVTSEFQKYIRYDMNDFFKRLNKLVFKYDCDVSFMNEFDVETMVIRNGVKIEQIQKTEFSKDILVSGRITQSKFSKEIIESFNNFNRENNDEYRLHFFGQVEEKNKEYLNEIKPIAGNNVLFHGAKPDLDFLKHNFAFTIVLGKHQGCPNTVLEAMSAYIPVIANDSGGTKELVNENTGIIIPEEFTVQDVCDAMKKIINSGTHEFCINSQKNIIENFSMSSMINNYEKILK